MWKSCSKINMLSVAQVCPTIHCILTFTYMTSHNISHTGKCIVANYTILSVTLYVAGIETPKKVDSKRTAKS